MKEYIRIGLSVIFCFIVTESYSQKFKNYSDNKADSISCNATKHFESQLPVGKKWKMVWNDEFDGVTLDTTKWSYRLYYWQTRHETLTKDGASLDGKGNLLLKVYEKDGKFYSSTLQTGNMYLEDRKSVV